MQHTIKTNPHMRKKERGFTLIEMAVVVLLLGLAIAALSPLYKVYLKDQAIETTKINIDSISSAIGNFRSMYGRYPCPASLTLQRDDPDYGRELCPTAAGEAIAGMFLENSIRAPITYTDPFTDTEVTQSPTIRVGFVPFRHLGLEEDNAYDGYDNRIMYVVTEHMAFSNSFKADGGGIEILNDQGASVLGAAGGGATAHFMVYSFGASNNGAFTSAGVQIPCVLGRFDAENCDFGDGTYQLAEYSESGDGATDFDDTVSYFTQSELPLWQKSEGDAGRMGDIHHKVEGKLGIGVGNDEAAEEENEVSGDVRAQDNPITPGAEGKVVTEQLCDENGNNCFQPRIFAGDIDTGTGGLRCPEDDPDLTGEFMVGIRNNRPVCEDEVVIRCPSGEFMEGVNDDGSIECVGPPPGGCPSQTVQVCGENKTLLASPHNATYTVTGGSTGTRSETYRCRDENWSRISTSGSCTCTAATWTQERNCGTGYSGTYTRTYTRVCPSGSTSYTHDYNESCECEEVTQTDNENCPDEYTGTGIVRERYHTCDPDRWSNWTVVSNDCTCVNKTEIRNGTCPTNFTGQVKERWEFRCSDEQWHYVEDQINTCTCEDRTEEREVSCPTGLQGTATETWKFTCSTQTWAKVSGPDYSDCRTCSWQPIGSHSGAENFDVGSQKGSTCACGAGTGTCYENAYGGKFYNYYNACQCQ